MQNMQNIQNMENAQNMQHLLFFRFRAQWSALPSPPRGEIRYILHIYMHSENAQYFVLSPPCSLVSTSLTEVNKAKMHSQQNGEAFTQQIPRSPTYFK